MPFMGSVPLRPRPPSPRLSLSRFVPRDHTLPAEQFERRHRLLRALLWLHAFALPLLSVARGDFTLGHDVLHGVPVLALAALAGLGRSRRLQSLAVSLGLLTASATLVHAMHGQAEAHFHFFVMISLLALYEDWLPFGVAVGYVAVHHLVGGIVVPNEVYADPARPVALALLHSGFILAAAVANVVTWRVNEDMRRAAAEARRRVEIQYAVSDVLAGAVSLDDAAPRLLDAIGRGLGADIGVILRPAGDVLRLEPSTMWFADPAHDAIAPNALDLTVRAGEGLAGKAWQIGRPQWSGSLPTDTVGGGPMRALLTVTGQRAGVAVPVRAGDQVLGVLGFSSRAERPAGEAVADLLDSIANQLAMFMDRLQRGLELQRMEDAALTDPLTGLPNRRSWDRRMQREADEHRGEPGELSVAVIDLDHFKAYNDLNGHRGGDQLLRACAAAWTGCMRERDMIARLGGDEFALLMPRTPTAAAQTVADRLRGAMPGGERCSVGVATWNGTEPVEDLVERADRALYAAKA